MISVEINRAQLQDAQERLAHIKNGASRALSRALNKTASKAKTLASRAIRDQINLSAAYVRQNLRGPANGFDYKATVNKLTAKLSASKRGILLYQFSTNSVAATGRPPEQIKVRVKPGRAIAIPSAFWVRTKGSNKLTPAVRNSVLRQLNMTRTFDSGSFTILHGPSLSQVFSTVKDDIGGDMSQVLVDNFAHEMEWLLTKFPPPGDDGASETP